MSPEEKGTDAPPPPPPPPPGGQPVEVVREQDKVMLVFSYLTLLALVPLLTVNDSEFVRWHAKNGLILTGGGSLLVVIVGQLPFIIGWLSCPLALVVMGLAIVCMYRALQGVRIRIPLVSDLADKL